MSDDRARKLADHIWDLFSAGTISAARTILADPQAHIDALVEAGVLEHRPGDWYRVVQPEPPHVHEPFVHGFKFGDSRADYVRVWCHGCEEKWTVPNRLPIEVPE